MKDRIEDKYILSLEEYFYLKEKIKTKFQKKYDDRIVNSTYFDTRNYKFFNDSEEGLLPRLKVRKRHYNNNIDDTFFEIKMSNFKFDKKYIAHINKAKSSMVYEIKKNLDLIRSNYLIETCFISYKREYFQKDNGERVTFDSELKYQDTKRRVIFRDNNIILEHKYNLTNLSKNLFQKQRCRFSKYSEALLNTVFIE